jgi:glyoxalase family protein
MSRAIPGLHHVTAISGPPQANVDFYVGTMRQRLVKRTVNFDAPVASPHRVVRVEC